jgi:hypothetical protein
MERAPGLNAVVAQYGIGRPGGRVGDLIHRVWIAQVKDRRGGEFPLHNSAMNSPSLAETLTAVAYRLGMYWANNAIDDPAMLAFIFC